jgi:flagellar hook-length control protein FliK
MAILLGLGNGSGGNDQASQSDALQSLTANGNPSAKSGASALGVAPTASQNGTDGSTGLSTTPGTTIPTDSPDWVSPFAASGNNSQSGSPVLASLTQAAHSLALAEGGEPESRHPAADSNLPPLNGPASVHAVRLAGAAVAEPSPTDPTRLVRQISEPIHQIAAGRLSPNSLTVHLSPPELGRVEIDVTRNSQEHSRIEVVIRVERPETERLLEQTMHRLHESLENRGVDLGNLRLDFTGSQRQQGWANDAQTHDETFQESIVETQSPKPTRVPFVDGSRLSVVV